MTFCPHCGEPRQPHHPFCASCGQPVQASATQAPPSQAPAPQSPASPANPTYAPVTASPRQIDVTAILRGNWVAALMVSVVAVVLAFGSSAALVWMTDPDDTSTHDRLVFSAIATASTVTADAVGSSEGDYDDEVTDAPGDGYSLEGAGGTVALTIAILSLGVAAWLFRRLTRGYPQLKYAIGDAVRTALVYAVLMMVLVIALRGSERSKVWELTDDEFGDSGSFGASIPSTFFLGFLIMFLVLSLACIVRRDWLGPRMQRINAFVGAPVLGVATFLLTLPVVGGIANLCFWFTADNDHGADEGLDTLQTAALIIASLGNVGVGFLGAGAGGQTGNSWDGRDFDEGRGAEWHRLAWAIDESGAWGLWFAIPTLLVVLALSAYVVLRRARTTSHPFANLMIWAGAMFVVFPLVARLASIHGSFEITDGTDDYGAEGYFGVKPADSLLVPLIAVVVALVVAAAAGAIDVKKIAAAMQQSPDRVYADQPPHGALPTDQQWQPAAPSASGPPSQTPTQSPPQARTQASTQAPPSGNGWSGSDQS